MSALMYSIMVSMNKKAQKITGISNATLQLIVSFLTVAAFVFFKQGFIVNLRNANWLAILILGIVNTGIGCYLYFSSLSQLPVQTVAICGYLEPLSAVLFSALLLHETLLPIQIIGAICILGGAVCSELFSKPSQPFPVPDFPRK